MANPWMLMGAGILLTILGLACTSLTIRRAVFFPIIVSIFLHVGFVCAFAEELPHNRIRLTSASLFFLLRIIELFVFCNDPYATYVRDSDVTDEQPKAAQNFGRRFMWSLRLLFTARGGGWNWRVPGTPPSREYHSKLIFARDYFAKFLASNFLMELMEYTIRRY